MADTRLRSTRPPREVARALARYFETLARLALLVCLVAAVALTALYQSRSIAFRYQLDYGEAPLLDQAARLAAGEAMYRDPLAEPPHTISNYPPVFPAALALFVRTLGPAFWYGRAVSALSAAIVALCIALIVRRQTRDSLAAAVAGLGFLCIPFVVYWSSLSRIDFLALAFSFVSLTLLSCVRSPRIAMVSCALGLTLAMWTRQTHALAGPLAAVVFLSTERRNWRPVVQFVALLGLMSLGVLAIVAAVTQGAIFTHLVTANLNAFDFLEMRNDFAHLGKVLPIMLVIGALSLAVRPRDAVVHMITGYLVGASLSALTIGKVGSSYNYFVELCAALALAMGIVVGWARRARSSSMLRGALFAAIAVQVFWFAETTLSTSVRSLGASWQSIAELRKLETMIAAAPGPVLADEHMGMVALTGQRIFVQPFEMTQLARAGIWDEGRFVDSIERAHFSHVLLERGPARSLERRWTPRMLRAIEQAYQPRAQLAGCVVWTPKQVQAGGASAGQH